MRPIIKQGYIVLKNTIAAGLLILLMTTASFSQNLIAFGVNIGPSIFTGELFNTHYPGGSIGLVFNLSTPVNHVIATLGVSYSLHSGKTVTIISGSNSTEFINTIEYEEVQLLSLSASARYGRESGPFLFIGPTANRFTHHSEFSFGIEAGVGWVVNRKTDRPKIFITLKHNALNLLRKSGGEGDSGIARLMVGVMM